MRTREAIEKDRAAYLAMVRRFYREGDFPFKLDMARQNAVFEIMVGDKNSRLWVVEDGGRLAGYLLASSRVSPLTGELIAQENMIWVEPAHRGGGKAAGGLMGAFLEWARSIGADRVSASAQASMRPKATGRFYRRFGLIETETHYSRRL